MELLSARLSGTARVAFDEWVIEDPEVSENYRAVKDGLPNRMGEKKITWKTIVDFFNLKMGKDEKITEYSSRYLAASKVISAEELQGCKFLFSLPMKIRELFAKYSGEWPRNLDGMVSLAQELVLRAESIHVDIGISEPRPVFTPKKLICFGCQGEGHYVSRCPKRTDRPESKAEEKSNSIKDNLNKYSSSVYLNVLCTCAGRVVHARALVDSGATENFVSRKWVETHDVFRRYLNGCRRISLAAGEAMISIREETEEMTMTIGKHEDTIRFLVVPGLHDSVILGKAWLDKHNPAIDWPVGDVRFDRCQCSVVRLEAVNDDGLMESGVEEVLPAVLLKVPKYGMTKAGESDDECNTEGEDFDSAEDSDQDWTISEDDDWDDELAVPENEVLNEDRDQNHQQICSIVAVVEDESADFVATFLGEDSGTEDKPIVRIPVEYRDYEEVFSEKLADELPPMHSKYQCAIDFKKDAVLPKPQKPYPVSFRQRTIVEQFIKDGLRKGTLQRSKSPIAMPMFLVPKKDGDARPVVDLRLVNDIIVDNRNPNPCIDDIMSYLSNARVFSKIDLANAYNLMFSNVRSVLPPSSSVWPLLFQIVYAHLGPTLSHLAPE